MKNIAYALECHVRTLKLTGRNDSLIEDMEAAIKVLHKQSEASQEVWNEAQCIKSPTGNHSESWFGNRDCEHCKSGAQDAPLISALD